MTPTTTPQAATSSTTTIKTAEMHLFVRIHGKAADRKVLVGMNGKTDHQLALPIFRQGIDYCELLHRTLSAALPLTLNVPIGPDPDKEKYYYEAANNFVVGNPDFAGYQLEHADVFHPQPSYWDGTKWVRPVNFVAYAYPFIKNGAASHVEKLVKGKTDVSAPESLFADFILTLQHYT